MENQSDLSNCGCWDSGIDPVSGIEAQRERGARISDQHGRTDSGAVLAGALYL